MFILLVAIKFLIAKKNLHISHEIEIIFLPQCLGTFLNQCISLFSALGVDVEIILVFGAVVTRRTTEMTPTARLVSFLKFSLTIPVRPINQKT